MKINGTQLGINSNNTQPKDNPSMILPQGKFFIFYSILSYNNHYRWKKTNIK